MATTVNSQERKSMASTTGNERDHAAYGVGEGAGHHRFDAVDVVRDPGLHFAGAGPGQEAQRHPQEVAVDRLLQVAGHILSDPAGDIGL